MPKRVVDGDALWKSDKLAQLPDAIKADANLIPLALANGSFECNPRMVWSRVYAYNRPEITVEKVEQILDELERVRLLFRWLANGKPWGWWVGINKPGRLPAPSRLSEKSGRHETLGEQPPADKLAEFLGEENTPDIQRIANGQPLGALGFGFGFGKGLGSGREKTPLPPSQDPNFDGHEWCLRTCASYPTWGNPDATDVPPAISDAYMKAIEREAPACGGMLKSAERMLAIVQEYARQKGPDPQFAVALTKFFAETYTTVKVQNEQPDEPLDVRLRKLGRL